MVAASKSPSRVVPASSPGSIEVVTVKLVLLMWSRWQGEVHKMSDGSLSLSTMWILHAELLGFCILIQRPKLLAWFVLWFAILLITWYRTRSRVAPTPALTSFTGEVLLGQ